MNEALAPLELGWGARWRRRRWQRQARGRSSWLRALSRAAKVGKTILGTTRSQPERPAAMDADPLLFARGIATHQLATRTCQNLAVEMAVVGPRPSGPALFVANHVSWLDPILLQAVVPMAVIGKHEVHGWPVVGSQLDRLPMIWLDRSCARSGARALLAARACLARGLSVLVFPEATTSHGEGLLPFRRGIFGLSRALDVPIIPALIDYAQDGPQSMAWVGDDPFFPHLARALSRSRILVRIDLLPAARAWEGEGAADFAERVRAELEDRLHGHRRSRHPRRSTRELAA